MCDSVAYLGHDTAPPGGSQCSCAGCRGRGWHVCSCGSVWHLDLWGNPIADVWPPRGSTHGASRDPLDIDPLLDDPPYRGLRHDDY